MNDRYHLDGQWLLWHFAPGAGELAGAHTVQYQPHEWITGSVPGDVHVDMTRAGLIDDPLFGRNAERCYWMETEEWWYRRTFTLPAGTVWERAELHFDGLDTTAAIWLNGVPVGQHDNFFSACTCDVAAALHEGENVVVVRLNCGLLAAEGKPYDKYYDWLRGHWPENLPRPWIRRPAYTFRWDWSPRLLTCGIWQGVELRLHRSLAIRDVFLVSKIADGQAVVKAHVEVESFAAEPQQAYLVACLTGDSAHTARLVTTLAPGLNKVTVAIPVDGPRLWWPNGSGEPYLYDFTLELSDREEVRDRSSCRYGIREVELIQEPRSDGTQSFVFAINGQRIFGRGANWAPADCYPATMNRERYHALVAEAAGANFNLFRVNGVGLYEKDSFFDVCDELGVMLWQDFTYSCGHYPDDDAEFMQEAQREAELLVRRLRNHPSLIMWCGNNENQELHYIGQQAGVVDHHWGREIYHRLLPGVCTSLDPTRPYWPGSAYGGDDPNDPRLGDRHAWDVSLGLEGDSFRAYAKDNASFVSEFGFLAPAVRESLDRFLPPDQVSPGSPAWNFHNNLFERGLMATGLKRYFGLVAADLTLDDYTLYGQIVQGEALKYGIEHYRRRKYGCGGALFWSYNDCWGTSTGWTIIDYYLKRKPSYYYVRRAFNPIMISFKEEAQGSLSLWGTNDTRQVVEGELVYGLTTLQGQGIQTQRVTVKLAADSSLELAECAWPDDRDYPRAQCVYWARLSSGGQILSENRCFGVPLEQLAVGAPRLEHALEPMGGGKYRLITRTDSYAWVVRVIAPAEVAVADNFFDILPGEQRTVEVQGPGSAIAAIRVAATTKMAA